MKFNHLNVPGHWKQYWSRYPEGYTILEALISWVSQVDSMVDNQNSLNGNVEQFRNEIDAFIGRFDERLQDEVTHTLKDWQTSGFLDAVIRTALQWQLDDYITTNEQDKVSLTAQLQQKAPITYVDNKISQMQNGVKGIYSDLSELQSSYPNGDSGNYVLSDNGHIYTWKNGWVDTGIVYQAIKIANGSVKEEATTFIVPNSVQNLFNPYTASDGYRLTTVGGLLADPLYTLSDFISVQNGQEIMVNVAGGTSRICGYNSDESFNKVVSSGASSGSTITIDFTGYIRVPVLLNDKMSTQVVDVAVYDGTFTPFEYTLSSAITATPRKKSVTNDVLTEKAVDPSKTSFIEVGKNLFNPDNRLTNTLIPNTVTDVYDTTDYIPIKSGEHYTLNSPRRYAIYNNYKAPIDVPYYDNSGEGSVTFLAPEDGFVRASVRKTLVDRFMVEVGQQQSGYEPYELKIKYLNNPNESISSLEQLNGELLVSIGDSIAAGSNDSGYGYARMIADKYGIILDSRAKGGATITGELTTNTIQDQLTEILNEGIKPKILFVEGGTNDISSTYTVGEIANDFESVLNLNTFCGGLESIYRKIKEFLPETLVIYITPHHMRKSLNKMTDIFEKGVHISQKYSIPVVDLYKNGNLNTRYAEQSRLYTRDTYGTGEGDGTHPNLIGYQKFYVPPIESKLIEILPK